MTAETGRPPKRRRTDDTPATISPEQILQSNATVQHFTGQRHNRWMQGYIPAADGDSVEGEDPGYRPPSQQTGNGRGTAASLRATSEWNGSVHVNVQTAPAREGTTSAVSMAPPGVVDYESPYPPDSNFAASTFNLPPHHTASTFHRPPGLPSPASSEDSSRSPVRPSMVLPSMTAPGPSRKPERPPQQPTPNTSSNQQRPASTNQRQHPPASLWSSGSNVGPGGQGGSCGAFPPRPAYYPNPFTSHSSPSTATQAESSTQAALSTSSSRMTQSGFPSRTQATLPESQPSRRQPVVDPFSADVLRARVNEFWAHGLAADREQGVDDGRLAFLREALTPDVDWFCIALSQLHALAGQKDLPEAVKHLPVDCWKFLDNLLCSNATVSPKALQWLRQFPFDIKVIYTSHISTTYSGYVQQVAALMLELPERWHSLAARVRAIGAPPVTQEVVHHFGLKSPSMQAIAFRAITRMLWNDPGDTQLMEHVEVLFREEQSAFNRGVVWPDGLKATLHSQYQALRRRWYAYLQKKAHHEAKHKTEYSKSFEVLEAAKQAFEIIAARQPAATVHRRARPGELQALTAQAQQQTMIANEQRLARQRSHAHQAGPSASSPVPRSNMPQQQTRVANERSLAQQHSHSHQAGSSVVPSVPHSNMPPRGPLLGGLPVIPMPAQKHPPIPRLVFPHERDGPRSQPTEPNPMRSALHEAHLRSPVPVPLKIGNERPSLFQYISKFPLSPTRLDKEKSLYYIDFHLPQDQIDRIPRTSQSKTPGELPNRVLSEQSQTYRVRVCAMPPQGFSKESQWVVADTMYPEDLYLGCNGTKLQMRRPLHNKKYLAIDITDLVKAGTNKIEVIVNRMSIDMRPFDFALAVEAVGVMSHATLLRNLAQKQTIPANQTRDQIRFALSGSLGNGVDDDEIAFTSSSMAIKLSDPFSGAKIFDVPVRGASCAHKDCFDLETFLSQCKRDKPGSPTIVDTWRCPICRGDVRPTQLVRDEFMAEVRESLKKQGRLGTRAIVVEADGSWKPRKKVEGMGLRSGRLEAEENGSVGEGKGKALSEATTAPISKKKKRVEVIELD